MASGRPARIAVFAILVAYWAGAVLGSQFDISPPGRLYDLWYSATPIVLGFALALGAGLYIARWWVLVAALTPLVVLGGLELAGHIAPWHDAGPPLTQYLWLPLLSWLFVLFALPLSLGVLVRRGLGRRDAPRLHRTS